jgi:hypothetical protein
MDLFYTSLANIPNMHSDPILSSTPWSSKWSLHFWLSHQNLVQFTLFFHACHISRPPHSLLDLICLMISGDEYETWRSSLCNFLHYPVTSFLFGPNILLRTLFSIIFSLSSYLTVRDQVSHPYKTTVRIIVLYILAFTFLYSKREDKRVWTEW